MTTSQTELIVYGPYDIPYGSNGSGRSKRIGREHAKAFWEEEAVRPVRSKQGCYVFALGASRGFQPWYVGKASKTFMQEALTDHKLVHYNDVIFGGRKGKPVMFFVARAGSASKIPKAQLDDLETFLIQSAIYKNPELRNKQKTKTPMWSVRGVVRGGRGRAPANAGRFKSMMGIS